MSESTPCEWSPALSVGHEAIDAQHRELIAYMARLQQSVAAGDAAATRALLGAFIDFTHDHFAEEEKLMRSSDYAPYLEHVMRHESLLEEVRQLKKSIDAGKTPVSLALLDFLGVWLVEHIKTSDRRLGRYLDGRPDPAGGD